MPATLLAAGTVHGSTLLISNVLARARPCLLVVLILASNGWAVAADRGHSQASAAPQGGPQDSLQQLQDVSFEAWFDVEVTTVSRAISTGGQNLPDSDHPEFGTSALVRSPLVEIRRGADARAPWRF